MLHALPVGDDVCVNYIKASAQKFVELYGNHGNLMVVVVSDLLASFSRFKPPILSQFGLRLSKAMNVALREQRQTIDFSHLQDMTNLVTTILGSKCSFPRKLLESASIDLLRAFLNSIPDPGEKPACMSWNRRVQIKAVVAQGDEIRLELGRYLHAFPEIYETPHWEPIQNCHILLMNIQLNLRDPCETVEFADLNCKTQRDFQSLANVMMVHMNRLISVCERLRVRIVINQRVVSRRIRGLFLKKGILLLERFGTEGIMAMQLVGNVASVLSTLNFHETLVPQCIGWIQSVDHVTLWRQDYLALSGRSSSNYSTLIVHHWNEETLEDIKVRVLVEDENLEPEVTLLTYLRRRLGLCGTKLGCGEGGCGACTVMLSYFDPLATDKNIKHISVNACLAPMAGCYGMAVTTVEGIGSTRYGPNFMRFKYEWLNPTDPSGNLCRCTGYRPILEGFKSLTESWAVTQATDGKNGSNGCTGAKNGVCCQQKIQSQDEDATPSNPLLFDASKFKPYDPSQELIFPPALQLKFKDYSSQSLVFRSPLMAWYRPLALDELVKLKERYPSAKIVNGNTELGVEMKFKNCQYPVMIQPSQVQELKAILIQAESLTIGAAVSLSDLEETCLELIASHPKHQTRILVQIVDMFRWFAGKQIRNVSAVGGNIMTGSPISDLNQIFMAAGAQLRLASARGQDRVVPLNEHFFTGYRRNIVDEQEILVSITIPFLAENQYFMAYKQARRRDDDIAIVNSAFYFDLDPVSKVVKHARMAFGGMAPTTVMPIKSMELCRGLAWDKTLVEKVSDQLLLDLPLPPGVPGSMVRFRRSLTLSFLMKAFLEISHESGLVPLLPEELSATHRFHAEPFRSHQFFELRQNGDEWTKPKVECVGQIIGIVLAKDQAIAQRAAKLVKVEYEELKPIITIEEAINANSFHPWDNNTIINGDVAAALKASDHVLEGEMRTGAQEHFYLETQACVAIPVLEDGEMHVYSSTQNPTETQACVAGVLGVSMNKIVCHVRRMGGGFGGKETRSVPVAMACALAAQKLRRPIRVMLDRDEDMLMSGHRHPFLARYKVGFSQDGTIKALDLELYNNAGHTMDLSFSVMERAMLHSDNSYRIENVHIRGHVCKTHLPSNTAFRGFGGPQGMMIAENWMDRIALRLKMDPMELRFKNLYHERDSTYFNTLLQHCTLRKCWQECQETSQLLEQRLEVKRFNDSNRWKKQGIYMVPVKFGIAFASPHMNQGGALVQIYRDGSVLLTHGGTEMGQGLHTKMIQVASEVLGIPHTKVHLAETATDKVPNTSPTAASVGSDINGMAVFNACHTLKKRLEPFQKQSPQGKWEEWVHSAYFARISLSAVGFYATPDIGYDYQKNSGNPFYYYTYGVGCSRVEIDCLTGDHNVLRTDIVMDLGESLNPAIDIGQIEGAFVQGYGLFVMEQLIHSPSGNLLTRGPGAYKIPGFGDIPKEFNVSLLRGAPNPRAVFSSKAVGEPPLFLSASVFYAIKDAIRAARHQNGVEHPLADDFPLPAPVTAERIRMACEDDLTKKVDHLPPEGSFKPWGIQISCDQALTTLRMMLSQPYVLPGGGCFEACLIKNLSQIPAQGPPLPCMESCLLDCVKMLTRICAVLARKKADDLWTDELLAHLWPEGDDTKSCICGQYEETPSRLIPLMSHYTMNRTPPKVELEISGMEGSSKPPEDSLQIQKSDIAQDLTEQLQIDQVLKGAEGDLSKAKSTFGEKITILKKRANIVQQEQERLRKNLLKYKDIGELIKRCETLVITRNKSRMALDNFEKEISQQNEELSAFKDAQNERILHLSSNQNALQDALYQIQAKKDSKQRILDSQGEIKSPFTSLAHQSLFCHLEKSQIDKELQIANIRTSILTLWQYVNSKKIQLANVPKITNKYGLKKTKPTNDLENQLEGVKAHIEDLQVIISRVRRSEATQGYMSPLVSHSELRLDY
eukprot:snap_masked-scaffold645_size120276-processed-gene-0.3 protein:Tk11121 transcript:snap_masked-scaffold645_size120276-processed-gene-0.3-mRNA-1 annotation:"xanthine dehydrogenase oxidase-like"